MTAIDKERYLSDEASLAISTANTVISTVTNNPVGGFLGRAARTYNVDMNVSLVSNEGVVLYNDVGDFNLNWSTTPNESVEVIGARISRSFPYRDL